MSTAYIAALIIFKVLADTIQCIIRCKNYTVPNRVHSYPPPLEKAIRGATTHQFEESTTLTTFTRNPYVGQY